MDNSIINYETTKCSKKNQIKQLDAFVTVLLLNIQT